MTTSLRERIYQDRKMAMRARDLKKVRVLGVLWADVVQVEVDQQIPALEDIQIFQILTKRLKQAKESEAYAQSAQREDIMKEAQFEQSIFQGYLPKQLGESAIEELIQKAMQETGASTLKELGQVMGWLKTRLQGQADLTQVTSKVKIAITNLNTK